jgi:extracellular elastinolytic metalloproteinase
VVSYQNATGAATSNSVKIKLNNSAVVGINDLSLDESFSIFPNPAKDYFKASLYNPTNANCTIEILNSVGQTLQLVNLGNDTNISNDISITNFASGMYMIKTTLGNKVSVKKLIIE